MSTAVAVVETEHELIQTAQRAISGCNWTVGECAAKWTQRFARGRTDADFGMMVGLSGDQVFQRRRVWETFADVREQYRNLKWSHFYVSLTWNDAPECLAWADENEATVAEMKAWRRLQNGDDLTVEAESDLDRDMASPGYGEAYLQRTSEEFGENDGERSSSDSFLESQTSANRVDVVSGGPASGVEGSDYAPFKTGATKTFSKEEGADDYGPVKHSQEDTIKRMTVALERCGRLLTDDFIRNFNSVPEKVRMRFLSAIENLTQKIDGLE